VQDLFVFSLRFEKVVKGFYSNIDIEQAKEVYDIMVLNFHCYLNCPFKRDQVLLSMRSLERHNNVIVYVL